MMTTHPHHPARLCASSRLHPSLPLRCVGHAQTTPPPPQQTKPATAPPDDDQGPATDNSTIILKKKKEAEEPPPPPAAPAEPKVRIPTATPTPSA